MNARFDNVALDIPKEAPDAARPARPEGNLQLVIPEAESAAARVGSVTREVVDQIGLDKELAAESASALSARNRAVASTSPIFQNGAGSPSESAGNPPQTIVRAPLASAPRAALLASANTLA